jgi:hypothetical protein
MTYRFHTVHQGRLIDSYLVDARDDAEAIAHAEARVRALPIEIWCEARRITTVMPRWSATG